MFSLYSKGLILKHKKHGNKWKTDKTCRSEISQKGNDSRNIKWAVHKCDSILNATDAARQPFMQCLQSIPELKRKALHDQCLEETCRCVNYITMIETIEGLPEFLPHSCKNDEHDCPSLCSWYASLGDYCRKLGHPVDKWRSQTFCRKLERR